MKKFFVSLVFTLLITAFIPVTAHAADGMTLCSVTDTVKGTQTACHLDDGCRDAFDYAVPEDGVTLLFFYGNTCSNSQAVIRAMAQSQWADDPRVNLVAMESQGGTQAETESFFQTYAGENASSFTVWYDNMDMLWDYVDLTTNSSSITFPLVFAVTEDNQSAHLQAASMGYQPQSVYDATLDLLLNNGGTEPTPAAFNYTVQNGEATITGFSDPSSAPAELVIPSVIDGCTVTRIGGYAFDYTAITSLTLPDTVTHIDYHAFMKCSQLSEVHLSDSLVEIGLSSFYDCDKLTELSLPDSLITIGESAFHDCDALTEITIPKDLTTLGDQAFYDCDKLATMTVARENTFFKAEDNVLYSFDGSELIFYPTPREAKHFSIPEGVTTIRPYAMASPLFETLGIPNSLEKFSRAALYAPVNLRSYIVADDHPTMSARNGILYSKDYTTLIACPSSLTDTFTVPEGVETIADEAFANCTKLTRVSFPTSLRKIGTSAFSECWRITSMDIPEGLTYIGNNAFYATQGLQELILPASLEYLGTYCFYQSWVTELYFRGNAPMVDRYLQYNGMISTIYYMGGSTGWENSVWNSYTHKTWDGSTLPILSGTGRDYEGYSYTWAYDRGTATLTLNGYAFRAPLNYSSAGWKSYASKIRHVILQNTVEMEKNLMGNYPSLESISLPATLQTIEDTAFNGAKHPITLTLAAGNRYFTMDNGILYNSARTRLLYAGAMEGITSFTVPHTVTHIDYHAFLNAGVTDMVLPSNLAKTSAYHSPTFGLRAPALERVSISGSSNFRSMDGILYDKDLPWIIFCPNGRTGSFIIPDSVTMIDDYAFAYSSLEEITFPESGFSIMPFAFCGAKVKSVRLTGPLSGIAEWAFLSCEMEEFILEDAYCGYVGDLAFQNCPNLKRVVLEGVRSTGDGIFSGCTSLSDVTLSSLMTELAYNTFGYCTSLTAITLPESITVVEEAAFRDCSNLQRIYVPGACPTIYDNSFAEMGITPLMLVDLTSDAWRLLEGSLWGGCIVTNWEKPESASAQWEDDDLTITLQGVCRADPLLLALYNEDGRMVDCQAIPMKAGDLKVSISENVTKINIFFLGKRYEFLLPTLSPAHT